MVHLYLLNIGLFVIGGVALLAVWRRHPAQAFARDLGCSTLCAALLPLGYLLHNGAPPWQALGIPLALTGAIPNLLFLASGVLRLAGRRLPPAAAAIIIAGALGVLLAPADGGRLPYWGLFNAAVVGTLGVLALRWLWPRGAAMRLLGVLLLGLGLNALWLLAGREGVAPNIILACLLRTAVGALFVLTALDGAAREAARLASRFQMLTEHSLQGLVVTDGVSILYANPAVRKIYGMPLGLGSYSSFANLPPASFSDEMLQAQHLRLQRGQTELASWAGLREVADGRQLELRFEAWRVEWDGQPATQILITDDSERNASARALQHEASHDKLTGLPNRSVLMRRLGEYCAAGETGAPCALVVLNLDRFTLFNHSQGHVAGDHLLSAFAAQLQRVLGARAELMRLGGDEFAIVDPDADGARQLGARLQAACAQPLRVDGNDYVLDASMGMAIFPEHGGNAEALLRAANAAMYQAKRMPGTALALAERRFEQMSASALDNEQALRKGIGLRQVYLDYQPKVDAASGALLGFEALARWQRPGVGPVSPVEFIAIAERTGLIFELGASLLARACRQIAAWRVACGECVPVAVNVSPVQLLNQGFPQLVERLLREHGVPPHCLSLEITESAAVASLEETQTQLAHLRALGVAVAMDDFGAGFSSLSMLRELPLHTVKIDRGLIAPLPADDAVAVVRAICQLAAALELTVVAEGIETPAQAQAARAAGCHALQGYLYARPLSVDEAGEWLRRQLGLDTDETAGAGVQASLAP